MKKADIQSFIRRESEAAMSVQHVRHRLWNTVTYVWPDECVMLRDYLEWLGFETRMPMTGVDWHKPVAVWINDNGTVVFDNNVEAAAGDTVDGEDLSDCVERLSDGLLWAKAYARRKLADVLVDDYKTRVLRFKEGDTVLLEYEDSDVSIIGKVSPEQTATAFNDVYLSDASAVLCHADGRGDLHTEYARFSGTLRLDVERFSCIWRNTADAIEMYTNLQKNKR